MIKREMMIMLHYDCVESPTLAQQGQGESFLAVVFPIAFVVVVDF